MVSLVISSSNEITNITIIYNYFHKPFFAASEIEEILQRSNNASYKTLSTETIDTPNDLTLKGLGLTP